jgi:hypothetical protein
MPMVAKAEQTPKPDAATEHDYDKSGLSPRQFLYAVMRDRNAPIKTRVDAAAKLLRLYPEEGMQPQYTIRIPSITCGSSAGEHPPIPDHLTICTVCGWHMPYPCVPGNHTEPWQ